MSVVTAAVVLAALAVLLAEAQVNALHVTVKKAIEAHTAADYWKAFLNISYYDQEKRVWHTERAETAR